MATNGASAEPDPAKDQGPSARPGRYARLRLSIGRHPSDVVRMLIAAAVVLLCRLFAQSPAINPVEADIASQLQLLGAWFPRVWDVVTWLGWWPGVAAAVGLSLYLGRVRLALAMALAVGTSWFLAVVIQWSLPGRLTPPQVLNDPGTAGFPFPDVRSAVIAALVSVASPFLVRSSRRIGILLVVVVPVASVVLGRNLPLDVFAGAVLGWGTGAAFHLLLGAPGRRASKPAVQMALDQAGIASDRIIPLHRRLWSPEVYEVVLADGERLEMKIVTKLHRRAGWGYRLRRMLASLDVGNDARLSSPRHEMEHEAFITLLAERAGVGTLPVVLGGEITHGPPFLIRRRIEGVLLSDLAADEVPPVTLDRIWADMLVLAEAQITHADLRAQNILIDVSGRPRIIDFTFSRVGGPVDDRRQDAAEVLVSVAGVVGTQRAVASILRTVDPGVLKEMLPLLQRLALHPRFVRQLPSGQRTLTELREALADALGEPPPSFRLPVSPTTVVMLLVGGLAVYLLLPELSSMDQVVALVRTGNPVWLAMTVALGFLGILASAVSVLGASHERLPFGRTAAVQLAAAFTGRTTAAGIGFYRINWVFLQRLGFPGARSVAIIALNRVVTGLVGAVGTGLGIVVIGTSVPFTTGGITIGWPVLAAAGALVVAIAVTLALPWGRRQVSRLVRSGLHRAKEVGAELRPLMGQPVRFAQLVGGCAAYLLLSACGLASTLAAFTPGIPLIPVLAVYVVATTLGQLVPTPGGLGAVEAATIAGLTAIGVVPSHAVAAALAARLLTYWLPVLPGIVAFRVLQYRRVI